MQTGVEGYQMLSLLASDRFAVDVWVARGQSGSSNYLLDMKVIKT
jgi:hypothetical protein